MPQSKAKNSPVAKALGDKQKPKSQTQKKSVKSDAKKPVSSVSKAAGLTVPVYSLDGAKKGTIVLPKEIFGAQENKTLMRQAVRVYQVNQRQGTASTKSRGEVRGSTRKVWRQKGTGRARHGAITAPIFVGGGVAFGPRPRKFELSMPTQMKRKALFSALSLKASDSRVFVLDTKDASGKTKEIYSVLKKLDIIKNKNSEVLFVADSKDGSTQGARNIKGVTVNSAHTLNTYEVLNNDALVLTKDAVGLVEKAFLGGRESKVV